MKRPTSSRQRRSYFFSATYDYECMCRFLSMYDATAGLSDCGGRSRVASTLDEQLGWIAGAFPGHSRGCVFTRFSIFLWATFGWKWRFFLIFFERGDKSGATYSRAESFLRGRTRTAIVFLFGSFFRSSIWRVRQLQRPRKPASPSHLRGYVLARFCIFFLWVTFVWK